MTGKDIKFDLVIVGMGVTGLSCVKHFSNTGKSIAVMDSRENPPELETINKDYPHVPVYLGGFDTEILCSTEEVIVSPGISVNDPSIRSAAKCGIPVTGDIEVFCRSVNRPVIAVTGSNGKSTVACLISEMITASGKQVKLGGNIGTPALDLVDEDEPDYYVLELSSFQLETTYSLNTVASVILNITQDHMDRYRDIEEYTAAKRKVYQGKGIKVINMDDEYALSLKFEDKECIRYGIRNYPGDHAFHITEENGKSYIAYDDDGLIDISDLRLHGRHNVANAMAALALGKAINLPVNAMLGVLKNFQGLPHRCQWIASLDGVDWYNDSKATNVGACCAAIEGFAGDNNIVLIAGGQGKGADFSRLADVCKGKVRTAILIGADANLIAKVLHGIVEVYDAIDMDSAVALARRISRPADIVLLSPACASFDMFDNYQHRGEKFIRAVTGTVQS